MAEVRIDPGGKGATPGESKIVGRERLERMEQLVELTISCPVYPGTRWTPVSYTSER